MDTSLHNAHSVQSGVITAEALDTSSLHAEAEGEHHIHLPNPSLWPFLLSLAVIITIAGFLFIPENPWMTIIGAPLVLIGILGWALEDPMAPPIDETSNIRPGVTPQEVLDMAQEVLEHTVTISSTAYSIHPVTVEIDHVDGEAVTLALYGRVELEAQRDELEEAMRKLPNVVDVRNYIIAEDNILNMANARLEALAAAGKLDGTRNISVLVENYILHLYGDVSKKETKYMLQREMLAIPGVRVVVNHIGLDDTIPGNLGKTLNK
jgi:hypothetical protein